MIYGHSHGAYLAYMCNRFCPELFQLIIENSAYIYPAYLKTNRLVRMTRENKILEFIYNYLINELDNAIYDEVYSLKKLYHDFNNHCYIISYHGKNDFMTTANEKHNFAKNIKKMIYMGIDESDVDGDIIKSCEHGLGADFIKLFNMTYQSFESKLKLENNLILQKDVEILCETGIVISINYDDYFPRIKITKYDLK